MDDDWDDLEDDFEASPSRRIRWQTVAAVVLSGVGGALTQLSAIPEGLACLLVADANHADNRVTFHEEAALEIEKLTQEG